jgi:hypothetical protein
MNQVESELQYQILSFLSVVLGMFLGVQIHKIFNETRPVLFIFIASIFIAKTTIKTKRSEYSMIPTSSWWRLSWFQCLAVPAAAASWTVPARVRWYSRLGRGWYHLEAVIWRPGQPGLLEAPGGTICVGVGLSLFITHINSFYLFLYIICL